MFIKASTKNLLDQGLSSNDHLWSWFWYRPTYWNARQVKLTSLGKIESPVQDRDTRSAATDCIFSLYLQHRVTDHTRQLSMSSLCRKQGDGMDIVPFSSEVADTIVSAVSAVSSTNEIPRIQTCCQYEGYCQTIVKVRALLN